MRIYRGEENRGWFITTENRDQRLFSFDIPAELLEFYTEGEELAPSRVLEPTRQAELLLQGLLWCYTQGNS